MVKARSEWSSVATGFTSHILRMGGRCDAGKRYGSRLRDTQQQGYDRNRHSKEHDIQIAKRMSSYCSPEEFGLAVAKHFVTEYPLVSKAKVTVKLMPWSRYTDVATGGSHNHGFTPNGSHIRTAYVTFDDTGDISVTAGVQGLKVLKTTQSGYKGFLHDNYTLLKDTNERILATSMTSTWKYCSKNLPTDYDKAYDSVLQACLSKFFGPPGAGVFSPSVQYTLYQMGKHAIATVPQVSSIFFNLPNLHFIPITPVNSPPFHDDVYVATSEPHGNIEACITRESQVPPHCKL
eukprot:jgi/Picre1/27292/NNA_000261.t1